MRNGGLRLGPDIPFPLIFQISSRIGQLSLARVGSRCSIHLGSQVLEALLEPDGSTNLAMTYDGSEVREMASERVITRFPLGQILMTPGAMEALSASDIRSGLARHGQLDWGDVGMEDWRANDQAVEQSLRILSVYHSSEGTKYWIITEADRSATTLLLPDEY
jgi:hypothetical protein